MNTIRSRCTLLLIGSLWMACSNPVVDATPRDATTDGQDTSPDVPPVRDVYDAPSDGSTDSSPERICYATRGRFYDDCTDSSAFYPPKEAVVQQIGDRRLMYINTNFEVRVFDLADGWMPRRLTVLTMPFPPGCGLPFGCSNPHFQYEDTVQPVSVATLGRVGYAFVPLKSYGWDMLRATDTGVAWFNTGNHGSGGFFLSGALFVHDGHLFLVGQMLDRQSVQNLDASVRIHDLGPTPPERLYDSLDSGVVLPLGPTAAPPYNVRLRTGYLFHVRDIDGRRMLFVSQWQEQPAWLAAFDVTRPTMPAAAGFWSSTTHPSLFGTRGISQRVFELDAQRLWVASVTGGSPARVTLRGHSVRLIAGRVQFDPLVDSTWPLGDQQGAGLVHLAAGYGVLAIGWMQVGKLFDISPSGTPMPLPDAPGYTDLSINLQEPCQYWDLARGYTGLQLYRTPDGTVYLYRAAMKEARMIRIGSCE